MHCVVRFTFRDALIAPLLIHHTYEISKLLCKTTEFQTRIAPALLGLRLALKISIYDYLPKFHQINAHEFFLNCYDAIIFIGSS